MQIAMIDDKMQPFDEVGPAYLDRGIFFGDGVYEVLCSYGGRLFALEEHLRRFEGSMAAIGITGVDIETVRGRVLKAVEASGIADATIYFHVTRGSARRNHAIPEGLKPNFFLTVTEHEEDGEAKCKGVAVSTHPDLRWKRCDIKSLNLLPNVLARREAGEKGCAEAILVDENGIITEGASSAFCAIFGQTLQTAGLEANILPSITRNYVIQAGVNVGLEISEKSLRPHEAVEADELLIASTTRGVTPVVRFDERQIGDGRPGPVVKRLMDEFAKFTGQIP
ncbi:MAG: aminotransferase class IV [Planctomycetota bacterium]|jgi:D-alanine transaminase